MTVTETIATLGQWSVQLTNAAPDDVRKRLGQFGHIAIIRGDVDIDSIGDALLSRARYVGVCRKLQHQRRTLSGAGMVYWLADEEGKGHTIETTIDLVSATLTQALTAVLPPTVTLGTVHPLTDPAKRYTGPHVFQSRREALTMICDAFAVEFRVNGNATVDVGRPDQLYNTSAATIDSVIKRDATGSDVDLTAVTGEYDDEEASTDYSTRVLLIGETTGEGGEVTDTFVTAAADAPVVPYKDLQGNPVKLTRLISDSRQNDGTAQVTAQLNLNRFNRLTRTLTVDADQYQADGVFVAGDATFVYDPESGLVDATREVFFRGEVLHPQLIRISSITWPVAAGHTVAFRTIHGEWVDLTRWVLWEDGSESGGLGTGGLTEIVVGDLPRSLTGPSGNAVSDRIDAARPPGPDTSTPKAPTGLTLTTTAALDTWGKQIAYIRATWSAVTQNTDNSAITDLDHYEVRSRPQFRAPGWFGSSVTADLSADLVAANDLAYDVEARAVDKSGNPSAWSATAQIITASDSTAPPTPADPLVGSYLGQLRIEYPGTDSLGNPMPADTVSVTVYVGTSAGFALSDDLIVDELNPFAKGITFVDAPYFTDRWVRLAAVDAAGNRGPSSAAVLGSTWKVVGDDIFIGAVGTAQLADLTVTTAKINELDLNNGRIGTLAVGKLTAGIMSADVTISGRFTTALTGARVEHNALGFQGFRSDGSKWLSLTPTESLLTGIVRTRETSRRVEIGAGGGWGEINLIAEDGTKGFVRTTPSGQLGDEVLEIGVDIPGSSQVASWNVININQAEFTSYRTKKHGFVFQDFFQIFQSTNRGIDTNQSLRFSITPQALTMRGGFTGDTTRYWDYDYLSSAVTMAFGGTAKLRMLGLFDLSASPGLEMTAPDGNGAILRSMSDTRGALMEVRNVFDTGFAGLRAGVFEVNSDARSKSNIRDSAVDALALLRSMRIREYELDDGIGKTRLGLVAQEAPAQVATGDQENGMGIDLYQLAVAAVAGVKQMDALLTVAGVLPPKGLTK